MKLRLKNFITKHYAALLMGLLVASTFCITAAMIQNIRSNIENYRIIKAPAAVTEENAPAMAMGEEYIVREYDGRIGVYLPGDSHPVRVIQVYVAYLPESDRMDLTEGICVRGIQALEKVLDDLRS